MKIKDITEIGIYTDGTDLYQVLENTDKLWLEEEPEVKLVVDIFNRIEDRHGFEVYSTSGNLQRISDPAFDDLQVWKPTKNYRLSVDCNFLIEVKKGKY